MTIDEHYFSQFRQAEEERLVQRLERLRIQRERNEAAGAPVQPAWTWAMPRFVTRLLGRLRPRAVQEARAEGPAGSHQIHDPAPDGDRLFCWNTETTATPAVRVRR